MNTMETYRKINQWTSHSRDMVESFKRYYHNSFLDSQRQEAYNLFLGNYIFAQGQPMLWDLSTDYYLHHSDPRMWSTKLHRSYINWFDPKLLVQADLPALVEQSSAHGQQLPVTSDAYWLEYYRPLALSSFLKIFSFRMNSTLKYISFKQTQEGTLDPSPFQVRSAGHQDGGGKRKFRKENTLYNDCDDQSDDNASQISRSTQPEKGILTHWKLLAHMEKDLPLRRLEEEKQHTEPSEILGSAEFVPADKSMSAQWTLDDFVNNSLNPSVTQNEAEEYQQYINHPHNLPLVTSTDIPANPSLDFLQHLNSVSPDVVANLRFTEEDLADYADFLTVPENPLMVSEADAPKKRYKAYRQWLKGKSLFKQQRVDA